MDVWYLCLAWHTRFIRQVTALGPSMYLSVPVWGSLLLYAWLLEVISPHAREGVPEFCWGDYTRNGRVVSKWGSPPRPQRKRGDTPTPAWNSQQSKLLALLPIRMQKWEKKLIISGPDRPESCSTVTARQTSRRYTNTPPSYSPSPKPNPYSPPPRAYLRSCWQMSIGYCNS